MYFRFYFYTEVRLIYGNRFKSLNKMNMKIFVILRITILFRLNNKNTLITEKNAQTKMGFESLIKKKFSDIGVLNSGNKTTNPLNRASQRTIYLNFGRIQNERNIMYFTLVF